MQSANGDVTGADRGGNGVWLVKPAAAGGARPAVVMVPGGTGLPTDTDADGLCDGVNGNGRRDFSDIVLYFNQTSWIAANEPLAASDCSANGRIDLEDVVRLVNPL